MQNDGSAAWDASGGQLPEKEGCAICMDRGVEVRGR